MSDLSSVRYAVLQPLTGGAYIGCEEAVGHPAEFIISYPGFADPVYNKEGKIVDAGNEYHLIEYLKKHNRMVPYYTFNRKPFDEISDMSDVKLMKEGVEVDNPNYSGIDLVVAVPVCSGLSLATLGASSETLEKKNRNMIFLAKYALNVIKPKVYIFENAPKLSGNSGSHVRKILEEVALESGYDVAFYRTDTRLHDNCQRRPRTFVYFFKKDNAHPGIPLIGFESKQVTIEEFLNRIPKNATHNEPISISEGNKSMLDYIKVVYGDNWRSKATATALVVEFLQQGKLDDWCKWVSEQEDISDKTKKGVKKYVDHIHYKESLGKGFFVFSPTVAKNGVMPSAMYKTIPCTLHYKEDRLYTVREWLSAMGMPYDFEMAGDPNRFFARIGQNVPARTMQFIASEAIRIIKNWDTVERNTEFPVILFDNIKQTVSKIDA